MCALLEVQLARLSLSVDTPLSLQANMTSLLWHLLLSEYVF